MNKKTDKRERFYFYTSLLKKTCYMNADQKGILLENIANYVLDGVMPKDKSDVANMIMFESFKENYDRDTEHYEEVCEKKRKAGSKGGKEKASKSKVAKQPQQGELSEKPSVRRRQIAQAPIEDRKQAFQREVMTETNVERYGADELKRFFNYWTELNTNGGLMRFEEERHNPNHGGFDLTRRLQIWNTGSHLKQKGKQEGFIKDDLKP